MAVEEASNVHSGDWIRIDCDGKEVNCYVTQTVHGPESSVLSVMVFDEPRRLEFLPDDPVMVTFYEEDE